MIKRYNCVCDILCKSIVSCCVLFCYAVLCCKSCCVARRHMVVSCCAMLCRAVLFCVVLCRAVLLVVIWSCCVVRRHYGRVVLPVVNMVVSCCVVWPAEINIKNNLPHCVKHQRNISPPEKQITVFLTTISNAFIYIN